MVCLPQNGRVKSASAKVGGLILALHAVRCLEFCGDVRTGQMPSVVSFVKTLKFQKTIVLSINQDKALGNGWMDGMNFLLANDLPFPLSAARVS